MADLREELLSIREEHGRLTAELVLDEARDPSHPLHDRFVWDDGAAAERYRVGQARNLIRSVKIAFQRPNGEKASVRQFVSLDRSDAGVPSGYEPTEEIVADPLRAKILLRQMEREVKAMQTRWSHMQEFKAVVVRALGLDGGEQESA